MYPDNILVWPDGFWCFREEFTAQFLRDDSYRVILHKSDEWLKLTDALPPVSAP